jgi:hypothetical protein
MDSYEFNVFVFGLLICDIQHWGKTQMAIWRHQVHGLLRGFALVGRHVFYRGAIPIFRQADIHQCKGRYYVLKEYRDGCEYPIMPRTYE